MVQGQPEAEPVVPGRTSEFQAPDDPDPQTTALQCPDPAPEAETKLSEVVSESKASTTLRDPGSARGLATSSTLACEIRRSVKSDTSRCTPQRPVVNVF